MGGHEVPNIFVGNNGDLEPKEIIAAKISAWARTNRFNDVLNYIEEEEEEKKLQALATDHSEQFDFWATPESNFNIEYSVNNYFYSLARIGLLDEAMSKLYSFGDTDEQVIWGYQKSIIHGLGRGGYHKKAFDLIINNKFFQREHSDPYIKIDIETKTFFTGKHYTPN
jgi:hypothetical protein